MIKKKRIDNIIPKRNGISNFPCVRLGQGFRIVIQLALIVIVAGASAEPVTVEFLPQHHAEEQFDFSGATGRSQFAILKRLEASPGAIVFEEGAIWNSVYHRDLERMEIRDEEEPILIRELFANLPALTKFEDLTARQRRVLYGLRAPKLALYLGYLKEIMATDNEHDDLRDREWFAVYSKTRWTVNDPEFQQRVIERRESEALEKISRFLSSDYFAGEPLFLVYGAGHRFKKSHSYSTQFTLLRNTDCEQFLIPKKLAPKTYEELQEAWSRVTSRKT